MTNDVGLLKRQLLAYSREREILAAQVKIDVGVRSPEKSKVQQLIAMGHNEKLAKQALRKCGDRRTTVFF